MITSAQCYSTYYGQAMQSRPPRVTAAFLDVTADLVQQDRDVHGYAIAKRTGLDGPTVYGILDRMEQMGWLTSSRELTDTDAGYARRIYRFTEGAKDVARALLDERRPATVSR
jgi:PadR family transcriptional regulator PadR